MSLEQIVRPFAAPQSLVSRRIIPATTQRPVETAGARWGKAGKLPVPQETAEPGPAPQINFNTEATRLTDRNVEKSRETELVRVENPDDPSQYIMVERATKITWDKVDPVTMLAREAPPPVFRYYAAPSGSAGTITSIGSHGTTQERDMVVTTRATHEFNPPAGGGAPTTGTGPSGESIP